MDGVLVLHKPAGLTSHDCVFKVRKLLRTKKVGHTGTLDPDVTGVLPICIGRATKIVEYLTGATKTYEGEVTLGFSTTTEDSSGEVVEEKKVVDSFSRAQIEEVLSSMTGELQQVPPMYSAVKVKGKKLYEYARQGIEVERPVRNIHIYNFELLDDRDIFEGEQISFKFRVTCSKGTYVRTLAVMIGEALGYPSHMSYLQRTGSGQFSLEDCVTFEDIERAVEEETINEKLHSIEEALNHLPKLQISDTLAEKVKNGAVLPCTEDEELKKEPFFLMINSAGKCLAIYAQHPTKKHLMKPVKVLTID
ncbi:MULTISPECIES: tRNA pseudouridine(55) synthase TruB [Priestia]|uniref:tRNA pseudouridine(55) synthase TruB n=1 Tax=Priestia TaxID=2800373 RepID=UPI00203EB7CA|nr:MULTISPECIES: tRNA pseudouridine(55) synthase TruB [Priestia]MCM3769394.1 tRNA pseudouridine(55) synthase TruB [Priestia aryabhattai]MDY0938808.1 tRNA pseudouridine(55) synthase TruB [Priestia megaterium]